MKTYTDNQILEKLKTIFESDTITPVEFEILQSPDHVRITVKRMYEAPGLSFDKMMQLGKFFDTRMIETDSEYHYGGCETCDYGSEAGYTLHITPGDPF